MSNYLDRKVTAEDIHQARIIIAALQAGCRHDRGISEGFGFLSGQEIVIRQCPLCGMFNPPR